MSRNSDRHGLVIPADDPDFRARFAGRKPRSTNGDLPPADPGPSSSVLFPIIDCDVEPSCPRNHRIVKHRRHGKIAFDSGRVELYRHPDQSRYGIFGSALMPDFETKRLLNACVLDFLLAHRSMIPESWESESFYVLFPGTVYGHVRSERLDYIRSLRWSNERWLDYNVPLDVMFGDKPAAAVYGGEDYVIEF